MINIFRLRIPLPTVMLAVADALSLYLSISVGFVLTYASGGDLVGDNFQPILAWQSLLFVVVTFTVTFALGGHQRQFMLSLLGMTLRLGTAHGLSFLILAGLFYVTPSNRIWLSAISQAMALGSGAMLLTRLVYRKLAHKDKFRKRVLVMGAGPGAKQIERLEQLERKRGSGSFVCVGFVPGVEEATSIEDERLLYSQSLPELVQRLCVDEIVVAPKISNGTVEGQRAVEALNAPTSDDALARERLCAVDGELTDGELQAADMDSERIQELLLCRLSGVPVVNYLSFVERERGEVDLDALREDWLIYGEGFCHGKAAQRVMKRAFDIGAALGLFILTLPLIILAVLAVWLDDGRPVLYSQVRVGLNGREFKLLKLRSMRVDAERDGIARWASAGDPRVTRVGAFLRRTRIDELPQIINILRGDLSFVGPRPERPSFVAKLSTEIPFFTLRHAVKPGLTGWAQINYAYGASIDDAREKLKLDLFYVKNHSLFLDLLILAQTARVVIWPPVQRGEASASIGRGVPNLQQASRDRLTMLTLKPDAGPFAALRTRILPDRQPSQKVAQSSRKSAS